ncbi:MAG: hypothetical protein CMI74_04055 [Candidatus Pelagibacter sp.]|nr:hypothetical protein [Candidatus Pelagibacter sp.]|tara:strand:- start:7962 stop:8996 length:1035 start_codon:yes stop_codon:yes gene_type:complete
MSADNVQNTTTQPPVQQDLDLDGAAESILSNWTDADKNQPSEESNEEAKEESTEETEVEETETDEDPEPEEEVESESDPEEDEEPETEEETTAELSEDTMVEILVDGESKQASIKDLKRLYGQEKSLTQKSQLMANERKKANEALQRAEASLQAMLNRAEERYKPYAEVDMLVASKQMNTDEFAALREEARAAESDLKFLREEADTFYKDMQVQAQEQQRESAKSCVETLKKDLPNWSTKLYDEIRHHAIKNGLPAEAVNNYTDPSVIKILHKAMMFDKTRQVAKVKKAKAPAKVLRSTKAPPSKTDQRLSKQKAAQDKLRSSPEASNDLDSIAEALMANWELD